MNELYEKLFAQAWIEFAPGHKTVLERFAELIVKECASIDFRHKIGLTSDQDYEVSNIIKEHFGVKE